MRRLIIVYAVCLFPVVGISCDPMTDVTFVNQTKEKLVFYTQSDWDAALLSTRYVSAESTLNFGMIRAGYTWLRVGATKENGEWVFDRTYTRDELQKAERVVVVSALEPVPPPEDVRVEPPLNAPPPVAPGVTFVNETRENLEFYTKSDVQATLTGTTSVGAGSSWETPAPRFRYGTLTGNFDWLRVAARRADGEWVFDRTYTWDELQKAMRRIVVSSLKPIVPPDDIRVVPVQEAPLPVLPSTKYRSSSGQGSP